jgi:DNA-binding protein H-NS
MTVENFLPTIDQNLIDSGVSKAEVEAWARNLVKAIDKSKKAKVEKAFADILEIVKSVELPAEELLAHLNRNEALFGTTNYENGKSKKLFKNPNSNETWGGIGRRPEWFVECLNQGLTEKDLLVSSESQEKADFKRISAILADLMKGQVDQDRLKQMTDDLGDISKNYLHDEDEQVAKPVTKTTKATTVKAATKTASGAKTISKKTTATS